MPTSFFPYSPYLLSLSWFAPFACRDARLVRPLQWYVHSSICSVLGGRTSRASLQRVAVCLNGRLLAPLFRSFFARKGTRICEQRELREALCLLGFSACLTRVGWSCEGVYARCYVYVKNFSEMCKYKALKDARESKFLCIALLLFIFVLLIISEFSILNSQFSIRSCSDPQPPNLGAKN